RRCQRQALAADLCDRALAAGVHDAAVYAQAGVLALELGRFARARELLLQALERGVDQNTWLALPALALAQKYTDAGHADFERFRHGLEAPGLSAASRTALRFAQAKAYDDIADYARASALLRGANREARALRPWSVQRFRADLDALLSARSG